MDNNDYPREFLRGISSQDFICEGVVSAAAFQFGSQPREDNKIEESINWIDDDEAIDIALNQRKDNGKIQFSAGVAILDLEKVKFLIMNDLSSVFSYERKPITGNKYHGNLLVDSSCPKAKKQLISSGLALIAGSNIIVNVNKR